MAFCVPAEWYWDCDLGRTWLLLSDGGSGNGGPVAGVFLRLISPLFGFGGGAGGALLEAKD